MSRFLTVLAKPGKVLPWGLLLVAVGAIALTLRLFGKASQSLWYDEMLSVEYASFPFAEIHEQLQKRSSHPPVYFALLRVWNLLGAEWLSWSEWVGSESWHRFPSLLFSILLIPVAGRVAWQLFDRTTSILTMLLLAGSVFHVHYAQEARMYALLALLGTLSQLFFLKLLRQPSRATYVGYFLVTVALLYTHLYGLFCLMGQSAFYVGLAIWRWRRSQPQIPSLTSWLRIQVLLGLCFAPWILMLTTQVSNVVRYEWIARNPMALVQPLLASGGSLTTEIVLGCLLLTGLWDAWCRRSLMSHSFVLAWLGAPMIIALLVGIFYKPICLPRHLILCSVALMIAAADGLAALGRMNMRVAQLAAVLLVSVLFYQDLRGYYVSFLHPDWRGAAEYLEREADPGAAIVFNTDHSAYSLKYYLKRDDLVPISTSMNVRADSYKSSEFSWIRQRLADAAQSAGGEKPRLRQVWVVVCEKAELPLRVLHPRYAERLSKALGDNYELSDSDSWRGVYLFIFDPKK